MKNGQRCLWIIEIYQLSNKMYSLPSLGFGCFVAGLVGLVVGASIGAMPFAAAMDLGYDLLNTIRFSALYPFLSAFLCFFFLRQSQKLSDLQK